MSENHPADGLDFSAMLDDELSEIVDSRPGAYPQNVVDGAKNELKKREEDAAAAEGGPQVPTGDAPPPVPLKDEAGGKLYSAGQVTLATFLGTPLAGSLIMARNHQALGKSGPAWQALAVGGAATILLIVLGFILPEEVPAAPFSLGSSLGMYYYVTQSQGGVIDRHLRAGGGKGSWAVTALVGILCSVILLGLLFAAGVTLDMVAPGEENRPVARIKVSRAGQIDLNGTTVTREQLRAALKRLQDEDGVVWYYRERWQDPPSEEATEVFETVIDARLPIRQSSKPDFSDYIGEDGIPVPAR